MIFNDSTKSSRHGMNKLETFCYINLFPFFKNYLLETGCWMESDAQLQLYFQYRAIHQWVHDAINETQLPDSSSTHGIHAHTHVRRIVSRETVTLVWFSTSLDNCSELACRFSSTLLIRRRSCWGVNVCGRPGRLCEMVAVPSFLRFCATFATVFWLISKALLIFLKPSP